MKSTDRETTLSLSNAMPGSPIPEASHAGAWRDRRPPYVGTAVSQAAILVFGVVSGIVTARLLGPQGRGELAAITLWPMALVFFANLGLNQAIVFHSGKQRHPIAAIWTTANALGIALSLVVVGAGLVLVPALLHHYSPGIQRLALIFLGSMPVLLLTGLPANLLQGRSDLLRFNVIRLIAPGFYALGVVLLLALRRPSVAAVVGVQIAAYVATLATGILLVYRRERPAFLLDKGTGRDLLSYGVRAHLTNLTSYFNQRADQLILSLLVPARELGLYAVAVTLSMAVTFVPVAAGLVTFSHGSSQSDAEARRTIAVSFRSSFLWLLVACIGLYLITPMLVGIVLGPRFSGAALACRVLLPGSLALGLNQVLYGGANAVGKPGLASLAEGAGLLVTAVGLVLLVPRYGYVGAAIVSTAAYSVSLIAMLVLCSTSMHLSLRQLVSSSTPLPIDAKQVVQA